MKGTDVFPSKYLRAADLDGREPVVTIDRVEMETLGDERKPVVYFQGKEKGLVMNKTNWTTLEDITGEEDSDVWQGTNVKLITVKVEFQGKRVPAIRIEEVKTNRGPVAKPAPRVTQEPDDRTPADDEIPVLAMRPIVLDISTAPLPTAADYLDTPRPDSRLKDPEKIAASIAEKTADQLDKAGLDPDLCRITGLGWWHPKAGDDFVRVELAKDEQQEKDILQMIATMLTTLTPKLIGFNSAAFDWPILMRRAQYLGVPGIDINCDRFKTPHADLYLKLSNYGQWKAHSLSFYAKRLGWTDLKKSLTGEEESQVPVTGRWEELADSLRHDAEATRRLAAWMGIL